MAITFVGSYASTHNVASAQSINLSNLRDASNNQPTLQQNDIVIVAVNVAGTTDVTQANLTPSGYTACHTDQYGNDSNDCNLQVSRKVMGASPDTTVSIPAATSTANGVAYAIYAFRGVDTVTPMDVAATVASGTNTGVANAPSITPVTPGAMIVAVGAAGVAAGAVFTNPSGMSATTNHFRSATITTTTVDANIGVALKTDWSSGAFDPAVFGGSTSTNTGSWAAATLALRTYIVASGSLSVSESGGDTASAGGDVIVEGGLAASESGADTFSASGTVTAGGITGSLSVSESGADSLSSSGDVIVQGSAAATEGGDTLAGSGDVIVSGSLSRTEGADTFSSAGGVIVQGALSVSEAGADVAAASGAVLVSGGLSVVEASDSFAGSGGAPEIVGSLSAQETGNETPAFGGLVLIQGGLSLLEIGDTANASGQVFVSGSLSWVDHTDYFYSALPWVCHRTAMRPGTWRRSTQLRQRNISRGTR